jgi:prepilin-type N-terminal cleavage/methylation domain-containing protein
MERFPQVREGESNEESYQKLAGGGIHGLTFGVSGGSGVRAVVGMDKRSMFFLRPQTRGRYGFTLVEVIVVLVILAILAAIAIPALTGYIDKAQDKKYIAQARDAVVAMRTVINEEYADGTLGKELPQNIFDQYFNGAAMDGEAALTKRSFSPSNLSVYVNGKTPDTASSADWVVYTQKADKLMGIPVPPNASTPGFWEITFYAPKDSSYNIFNAPSFLYAYYPNPGGANAGNLMDAVVYGFVGLDDSYGTNTDLRTAIQSDQVTIDPSAGYQVFHNVKK